ncbi:hypothetical protein EUTSA_v10023000mg [Eutrema salsugineum]|uniref:LOB domain-containing protein n=1 Tax=Eutrema salsugineum TaxID=72664 RepID=V4LJ28_EUTSA|nr:LOB domain-containing protein 5 [Eutrema salsugineum]ESQ50495.1 hypothetical protein EUTSA_v10023000mg [Eutrema salsugineum]
MEAFGDNFRPGPCAVCTTRNRRCSRNCAFAAYFPSELQDEFECANELFGTQNIIRMMRRARVGQRSMLALSIIMEGVAWTHDPVQGGFGMLRRLLWEIRLHDAYLCELKGIIKSA